MKPAEKATARFKWRASRAVKPQEMCSNLLHTWLARVAVVTSVGSARNAWRRKSAAAGLP